MSSRKALFFDVDGTLLDEKTRRIPESAVKAVQEARRQGHLAFVNSGRVSRLLDSVRDMIEMDGWLCGCGTYLIAGGRELYARSIPHERGVEIRRLLKQHRIEGMLEGKGGCYLPEAVSWMPAIERSRRLIAAQGALSPLPLEDESYDYDKFCCITDENSDKEGFFGNLQADFDIIDRGNNFWECVPKGHSKATAIAAVLKEYGLSLEDAYVFGDSTNDLPMFAYAKNRVLMGKHDRELEVFDSFLTRNVEEDGIAWALKQLGLI